MKKIEFTIVDGRKCRGYLFKWKGLYFAITRDIGLNSGGWEVVELQTGCPITDKRLSTRKQAHSDALRLLQDKGIKTVKKRLKEVFTERGKSNGKAKTTHFTATDNFSKSLCGRKRNQNCIPVSYHKLAKKPCKRCKKLAEKSKTN
jgi:hypothetical protein